MATAIRIGTRGSALALVQARLVAAGLDARGEAAEIVTIETSGDRQAPDTVWGEGAFVTAIEDALLRGDVDVAVHSAKDVPTDTDPRLAIAAFLERADPLDALVLPAGSSVDGLEALPRTGLRVGTDSPRRAGFLRAHRPDLVMRPLHGNVDTRLRRLDSGDADALVLAVAGLVRLGRADRIVERLDAHIVPPAAGQGAIAVQVRRDDGRATAAVGALDDARTRTAVEAERRFLALSGGGCRAPIGALATVHDDGTLTLLGGYASPDGSAAAVEQVEGDSNDAGELAAALVHLLSNRPGGRGLAAAVRPAGAPPPGHDGGVRRPRVLVTRAADQASTLIEALAARGVEGIPVPSIAVEDVSSGGPLDAAVAALSSYAWAVATSANTVAAVRRAAERGGVPLDATRWAAVGGATARALEEAGVRVAFQPLTATGASLAAELPVAPGDRVLVPASEIASHDVVDTLRSRGARPEGVVAYRTREAPAGSSTALHVAFEDARPDAVLFTSPSTVRGFLALAEGRPGGVQSVPAICVGPVTSAAAERAGFRVIATATAADAGALAATTATALGMGAR